MENTFLEHSKLVESIVDIPTVILCGGKGLRIKNAFPDTHKSLIPIQNIPILNRIMRVYSNQGVESFILLLGYLDEQVIRNFTASEAVMQTYQDKGQVEVLYEDEYIGQVTIRFIHTGRDTTTSGRLTLSKEFLLEYSSFFLTYADGLSDVCLQSLLKHHEDGKSIVTVTGVQPILNFGVLNADRGKVLSFQEKPRADFWVNGGFMTVSQEIFEYIDSATDLERSTFNKLVDKGKMGVYYHKGFWRCMDTEKDYWELQAFFEK